MCYMSLPVLRQRVQHSHLACLTKNHYKLTADETNVLYVPASAVSVFATLTPGLFD